jgi:hypothetical protein
MPGVERAVGSGGASLRLWHRPGEPFVSPSLMLPPRYQVGRLRVWTASLSIPTSVTGNP